MAGEECDEDAEHRILMVLILWQVMYDALKSIPIVLMLLKPCSCPKTFHAKTSWWPCQRKAKVIVMNYQRSSSLVSLLGRKEKVVRVSIQVWFKGSCHVAET
jgi:hypothetical protein